MDMVMSLTHIQPISKPSHGYG